MNGTPCTLEEAAAFITEQARELSALHLVAALTRENLAAFQDQATKMFTSAQSGYRPAGRGYQRKKEKLGINTNPGVLSGAWRDYRTMTRAEIVLKEPRTTHDMAMCPIAIRPSSQQIATRRLFMGSKGASSKPWVNYPRRRLPAPAVNYFKPVKAYALPGLRGANVAALMAQLPLYGVNWRSLNKRGTKVGRISGKRLTFANVFKKVEK